MIKDNGNNVLICFLSAVFTDLTTASDFKKDFSNYLANTTGRAFASLLFLLAITHVSFFIMGELPYRWQLFVSSVFLYSAKELIADGANGRDTILDIALWAYPTAWACVSFKETELCSIGFSYQPNIFGWMILCLFVGHVFAGTFFRWKENCRV